jgi:hypothetical protein
MADTFTVEVDFTDRTRNADRTFVTFTSTVRVLADTDTQATQMAAQMVAAIRDTAFNGEQIDGMVIATRLISCEI